MIDPPEDLALMQEEIFGPILPVAYDTLDEAIAQVNGGERPLALYVFAKDEASPRRCCGARPRAVHVNSAAVHGALPSLPFGGIGQSGSGATTASRASANSPISGACSYAARAT